MIRKVEIDLSIAQTNEAGEIFGVVIRSVSSDETKEYLISTDARGIQRGTCPESEEPRVRLTDYRGTAISEQFANELAEFLGIDLGGRILEEFESSEKCRVFVPVRQSREN